MRSIPSLPPLFLPEGENVVIPPLHSETPGRKSCWEKPKRTKADSDFTPISEAVFPRREVDDHICGSGESVSPKARASSGVRPFFSVRLNDLRLALDLLLSLGWVLVPGP